MSRVIFQEGSLEALLQPSLEDGFGIQKGLVVPDYAADLRSELIYKGKFPNDHTVDRNQPQARHDSEILHRLSSGDMPLLEQYITELNAGISNVTGVEKDHLTYLTVRVCPVNEMSTRIHRNDEAAGPWLVSLVLGGSGSFMVYDDSILDAGEEIELVGDGSDPEPIAASDMERGDGCAIYSGRIASPHAGGRNTSVGPKELLLLYGWNYEYYA